MKTQLLLVISLILELNICFGQPSTDVQWLIRGNKGKDGMTGNLNTYNFDIGTSLQFALGEIDFPNKSISVDSRKDFFAIYSNYSHFNTRDASFSFNTHDGSAELKDTHNFNIPAAISYLYISSIYEEDDYPPEVSVSGYNSSGTGPYNMTFTTSPSSLYANHEVVFDKDITLIINLADIIAQHNVSVEDELKLTFNQVEDISHSHHIIPNLNIFDASNAFYDPVTLGYFHSFPIGSTRPSSGGTEEIVLNMSKNQEQQYIYVNLKPNNNAENYAPIENRVYNAVFQITKNGEMVEERREEIRHSHDPNFLRVDSIAEAPDSGYYVFYHLEFENDGNMIASALKAKVKFPPMFDLLDLQPIKWFSGERLPLTRGGTFSIGGDSCVFHFPGGHPLSPCTTPVAGAAVTFLDTTKCRGFVEFRVKVRPGHDVTNPDVSLLLKDPKVSMDNIWYDLNEFYDLIRIKRSFPFAAQLFRPVGTDDGEPCIPGWVWIVAIVILLLIIFRKRIFARPLA